VDVGLERGGLGTNHSGEFEKKRKVPVKLLGGTQNTFGNERNLVKRVLT